MNLKLAIVAKYAQGSAPFVGIPLAGVGVIVFLRKHLQSALSIEPSHIVYNRDTQVVTFRAYRREWKLNDLLGQGKISQWDLRVQLNAWAKGRRSSAIKRKETAALSKHGVYVRRLREVIAKLTKQRNRIHLSRPVHPLIPEHYKEAGDYSRRQAADWAAEKPMRKAIARLVGQKLTHGSSTWAEFYWEVEVVTGRPFSESATYARVHGRKRYRHGLDNYPDREAYLKALRRYLCFTEKPYDHRPYDPYQKETYEPRLNAFERHAVTRREYVAALRERMAIDSQISAHTVEIASVTAAVPV